jgi:hypothetical protein
MYIFYFGNLSLIAASQLLYNCPLHNFSAHLILIFNQLTIHRQKRLNLHTFILQNFILIILIILTILFILITFKVSKFYFLII